MKAKHVVTNLIMFSHLPKSSTNSPTADGPCTSIAHNSPSGTFTHQAGEHCPPDPSAPTVPQSVTPWPESHWLFCKDNDSITRAESVTELASKSRTDSDTDSELSMSISLNVPLIPRSVQPWPSSFTSPRSESPSRSLGKP